MEDTKELYQQFSKLNKDQLPFSLHYEWWNEVIEKNWDCVVVHNQNQVSAIWPFFVRRKGPFKLLCQPHFTPYSGAFLSYPEGQKPSTKVGHENKTLKALIDQLPEFAELEQNFHLNHKNSLPFTWEGFKDEPRYTYLLDLTKSEEDLWLNFRDNIRKQIKKAEKTLKVQKSNAINIKACFEESFKSQKLSSPIDDDDIFRRIAVYIEKYNCGYTLEAVDENQNLHAALLCIFDNRQAYYLIGGSSSQFSTSGAMSLLQWEAIKKSKSNGLSHYNFEGSSIPSIEKYLRGFGGELIRFSRISKKDSKAFQVLKSLKP